MRSFIERPRYLCALGGALSTLEALPDVIPVLHTASGCAASIAWGQNGGSALNVGGYCGGMMTPGSNVGESEIVFGGSDRLEEQLKATLDIMDGRLYVVLSGCVTEIIGDDVKAVIAGFSDAKRAIAYAATGGFKGNSYVGYDIVLTALVRQFVKKNMRKKKGTVNILGIVPYMDGLWRGNLEGLKRSLELLGLKANTFFTLDAELDEFKNSSAAELNIVVSDIYGHDTAKAYKEEHGVPYIVSSFPIGPTATANLLGQIADALSLDADVSRIIETQRLRYFRALETIVDCYHDADLQRRAVIIADVNYAVSATRFLFDDLGWIPELIQFTDILTPEQEKTVSEKVRDNEWGIEPLVVFDTTASEAIRYINERYPKRELDMYTDSFTPGFVIGSSLERDIASKLGAAHLSVSFPISNRAIINRGYTGFDGGLTFTEDLLGAVIAGR
jgi:nitrogenase molybdenum-iron protein beta chain